MDTPKNNKEALKQAPEALKGHTTPRIHTPLHEDLPSKGQEMIDFCKEIGWPLLPWQEWLAIQAHRYHPETGKWAHPEVGLLIARQNGKSTFLALRVLTGMYLWGEKLQVGTAHKLTTSSEIFNKIYEIIESNPKLLAKFDKKIESKGSQEIKALGNRYIIRANNAASRGISSPNTIHMDEVREYKDEEVWAAMRYTQMATQNPQAWVYSNAGDQHSIILNKLRDRALAKINGADDKIAWFEWSGVPEVKIDPESQEFWHSIACANPSMGYTISEDNIKAVLHDDDSIIRTEVLCNWVTTINPVVDPNRWNDCQSSGLKLDRESLTWMAIDLSPDRKSAALVAGQKLAREGQFVVALLNTWSNPVALDDKYLANEIAGWVRKYHTDVVAYSARTAGAVALRLKPAGINVEAIDGQVYATACDQMLAAINSGRLRHLNQEELTKQALSAVKLPYGDGGWVMGRKVSNAVIAATVAMSMVCHFATQEDGGDDVVVLDTNYNDVI